MVSPRWPDVFLVGAPRCGTTALYTALKQHPALYAAVHKEPHFFGTDLTCQPHTVRDPELYLDLFSGAAPGQRLVDGSVWYLRSTRAAEQIAARRPEAHIIVMLRDPIELMRSLHALFLRTGNEDAPCLMTAIEQTAERAAGRRLPPGVYFPEGLDYLEAARFAPGLQRFLTTFGPDRVDAVLFDDFVSAPAATCRRLFTRLGIDHDFEPAFGEAGRRAVRAQAIEQLRRLRRRSPELVALLRRRLGTHHGHKPALSADRRRALRAHLAEDISATGALIGRDLSHWSSEPSRSER